MQKRHKIFQQKIKLSIVIPAYHEEKNILKVINEIKKKVNIPREVLIICDMSDPTYFLVEKYKKKYKDKTIVLIDNKIGSGRSVMKNIRLGFSNSKGDAIVVLMADLSDDISQIDNMYRLFKKGFDIVCASRYMEGGKKIGGPILKTILSKTAGLSLFYLFHIPTHDSTNAFKLYNRKIFRKINVESTGGFEYSLEIILKAYKLSYLITEIPTTWIDREEGSSNFKILAWLPKYIRWYMSAFRLPFGFISSKR